jgi:hypothetical protein
MTFTVTAEPSLQYLHRFLIPGILALLLALLCFRAWRRLLGRYPELRLKRGPAKPAGIPALRRKYLAMTDDAERRLASGEMNVRDAYRRMSYIARAFVYEGTGIHVRELTLSEIEKLGLPELEYLVRACYPPEFSPRTPENAARGFALTRKVIRTWNFNTRPSRRSGSRRR